ncbi:MAG: hypothetical protein D6720_06445 [Gammaproteobacteria bacterium]|nr:MAG: hypothetical protein D6720_06445 [Gammaproteobacteria bacterium]
MGHPPSMSSRYSYWLWCLLLGLLLPEARAAAPVQIGVLAFEGEERALARWRPLAEYLTEEIPGRQFRIVPLTHEGFRNRIRKRQLDFVLTNPAHYVGLEVAFGVTRIATLRNRHGKSALTRFGAVIFTRSDSPITTLEALRAKRLAAVNGEAFGGFLLARRRLRAAGIDPLHAMRPLWLGFPQREIVLAVLAGRAEAGTVRTGVIEQMIEAGEVRRDQLRILGERQPPGFPLRLSTELYPEWPMARLPHTDPELARQVTLRLLQMPRDSAVAQATRTAGWTIPLDYQKLHEILRQFQLPPYQPRPATLGDLWRDHGGLFAALFGTLLLMLATAAYVLRMHRALRHSHRALMEHRDQLEERVEERTRALLASNEALRQDIQARMRQEEALQGGCECLQGIHALIVRDDLACEQRLQSILDHLANSFGARQLVFSRLYQGEPQPCGASPPQHGSIPMLWPEQAQRAIESGETVSASFSGERGRLEYLACPVVRQGRTVALLELSAPEEPGEQTRPDLHSELGMRILHLVAQWLAYEDEARCQEAARAAAAKRLAGLTPRESEVLLEVARGAPNKVIARHLGISIKTVELHRSNLMRKLERNNVAELTRLAIQAGLLKE